MFSCTALFSSSSESVIEKGVEVQVEIKEGSTLNQVAQILEEKGIIDSALVFKLYVQQKGKEKNLQPGKYDLLTGSDYDTVLEKITTPEKVVTYKFTIPEGFNVEQIKERILQEVPFIESDELDEAMKAENYLEVYDFLDQDTNSLEGFLFPKTYEITADYTEKNIVEMLLTQFQVETQSLDWETTGDLSKYDIIKIASLIEREAYIPEERELISAVIHNRLKIGMMLQIDATIQYALGKPGNWWPIINLSDYKLNSPFNTYVISGLPPTPICNPGLASIKAALKPADADYLYYVVVDENTHEHKFSTTFEEHEKAKNQ
jgi:UPF0755 protein